MKIVIASDSFKESLSSDTVNTIIEKAIKKQKLETDIVKVVIADGGEGTVDAVANAVKSETRESLVTDALAKGKVKAKWALFNNGNDAIIEAASVVGLNFIPKKERDPYLTTTYGLGELIKEISHTGVENIYIGLGGSSTNDGGSGALRALGIQFLNDHSKEIALGGYSLLELGRINTDKFDAQVKKINFVLLSDVENVLCGFRGASYVYAPQKGASPEQVEILDKALFNFQKVVKNDIHRDISSLAGGGAAGGIGAGFHVFLNAEIRSGIKSILELIKFENIIQNTDLIITGEGKIDSQTKYGKAISGICGYAKKLKIPVIAFSAILEGSGDQIKNDVGLQDIFHIVDEETTKEMSISDPEKYLSECVRANLNKFI